MIVVTLVYIYILNKSPPPEGLTEAKLEAQNSGQIIGDPSQYLADAQSDLTKGDVVESVKDAVGAASLILSSKLRSLGVDPGNMNISDMAYVVQARSPGMPDITQPVYQLNLLHLRAAQSQEVSRQEGEWAISTATWLRQVIQAAQISQ